MTVKILGHWELGYHAPVTEQQYWVLPIRDFGLFDWNMVPVSGIRCAEANVKLVEWRSYEEFFMDNSDLTRVFLEPRTELQNPNTTWLHEFDHPKDCVYVFGSAHYNPTMNHCRAQDHVVTIKTIQDKGVLWADQALVITLYDRMQRMTYAEVKDRRPI